MLALTLLISIPQSLWYTIFGFPISRFYSNVSAPISIRIDIETWPFQTLLDTLLCREGLRGILNQTDNVSLSPARHEKPLKPL